MKIRFGFCDQFELAIRKLVVYHAVALPPAKQTLVSRDLRVKASRERNNMKKCVTSDSSSFPQQSPF
jgi:hypothetical protein